ncbi:TPA: hypothetical protein ACH9MG_003540, partial [Escherichia coli]
FLKMIIRFFLIISSAVFRNLKQWIFCDFVQIKYMVTPIWLAELKYQSFTHPLGWPEVNIAGR